MLQCSDMSPLMENMEEYCLKSYDTPMSQKLTFVVRRDFSAPLSIEIHADGGISSTTSVLIIRIMPQ